MAKANITEYDSTAGNNTVINDIDISEGCSPSTINNAIRELMAHLKNVDTGTQALTALSVTGAVDLNSTLNVQGETTLQTHLNLGDNDKIKLGASGDLEIYHDGSNSYIQDTGTGQLRIDTDGTDVRITKSNAEYMATFNTDGAVELYHDNSKKFETASSGVNITGGIGLGGTGSANQLDDYEEGTFTATASNSVTFHTGTAQNQLAYTKIGRQVHVAGSLQINNSNGGSALTVNNLPFTSMNNANIYYTSTTIRFYNYNVPIEADGGNSDTINFVGRLDPNSTTLHFMQSRDNNTTIVLPAHSGAYIIFGITYFTE